MKIFIPNPARSVTVPGPTQQNSTDRYAPVISDASTDRLTFAPKSSADMLDYTVQLCAWFDGTGDGIVSASVSGLDNTTSQSPLTVAANFCSSNFVTLILTSGEPQQTYNFSVEVKTQMGLVYSVPLSISINDDTPATPPRSFDFPATPIDGDSLSAFLNGLPLSAPASGGWWNNAGIPTLAPTPSKTTAGKA